MALEHWNQPRIAVVLLHNEKLRLSHQVDQRVWRFPEANMEVRDRTPAHAAERIMRSKYGASIVTHGILDVWVSDAGDHSAATTIYVLARMMDERTNPQPGLSLRNLAPHQIREHSGDDKLAPDVVRIYEQAKALLAKEGLK